MHYKILLWSKNLNISERQWPKTELAVHVKMTVLKEQSSTFYDSSVSTSSNASHLAVGIHLRDKIILGYQQTLITNTTKSKDLSHENSICDFIKKSTSTSVTLYIVYVELWIPQTSSKRERRHTKWLTPNKFDFESQLVQDNKYNLYFL